MTVLDGTNEGLVLALLRHDADVFARDRKGKTALEWARLTNNTGASRHLEMAIQAHIYARRIADADENRVTKHAHVLERHAQLCKDMQTAVAANNVVQIRALIQQATDDGMSADVFREAATSHSRYFLDVETSAGWSALTKAASVGDLPTIELLVQHGADVNLETKLRHTALTWAAYCGHKDVVQFLLQNQRADWRQGTSEGKTALIHASRNGQHVVVGILVAVLHEWSVGCSSANRAKQDYAGDHPKAPPEDKAGMDAMGYAKAEGHAQVVSVLQTAINNAQNHLDHVETLKAKTADVACNLGCGFHHAKDLIGYHQDNKCPHRMVECEFCNAKTMDMDMDEHKATTCAFRLVRCKNNCAVDSLVQSNYLSNARHMSVSRFNTCTGTKNPTAGFVPIAKPGVIQVLMFGQSDASVGVRSDDVSGVGMALTLEGAQLRTRRLETFLATEMDAAQLPPLALPFLRRWLSTRLKDMVEALAKLHVESTQLGLVVRYDQTTDCHLLSVQGACTWVNLNHTYFAEDASQPNDWKCGWLTADSRNQHQDNSCPLKVVPCPLGCGQMSQKFQIDSHVKDRCIKRTLACRLGCGLSMSVEGLLAHEQTQCPLRCVECPQCQSTAVRVSEFTHHIKFMCPERQLFCQKGCGASLRESQLDTHEALDCAHRPVVCPLRCAINCAASTLQRHLQTDCPRRLVSCPNRCGARVPAVELPTHLRNCDHRMVRCGAGSSLCARPLKAWITPQTSLDRCFAHHEHGFMWALKTSDVDTILTFLHRIHKSALDEEFTTGFTPLALACSKGDTPLVRILLHHGADVNLETSRGRTPLGEACLGRHVDVVELLLRYRAVVQHTNRHGLTTISIARQMAHDGILAVLDKRHQLELTQRRLFVAIATSNYADIETIIAGGEMAYRENHAWHLGRELTASLAVLDDIRTQLTDHMNAMNVSIADSEAKQMKVVKILDSVEYNKAQLEHVQKKEAKVEAFRQVTELTVKRAIQAITAQDILGLISQTEPSPGLLVVLKAMALFNGVIPKVKRGTDVNGFSDKEWWETSQAMLMDRQFLGKLVNFQDLDVPPDVLFKVRRECLKHDAFPTVAEFEPEAASEPRNPGTPNPLAKSLPLVRRVKNDMTPFLALSTWVRGVEVNQKSKAEAKLLDEKKAVVQTDLATLDGELKNAKFDMKTAHRSLPSRQQELDRIVALEVKAAADTKLKQRRVDVCELLAFTSLNGHTPLTFAASIGNERAVRLLLNRGANGSYSDEEQRLAAKILQNAMRHYVHHIKLTGELATLSGITGFLSLKPLTQQFRRYRQCSRVALHEAAYNGHHEVLELLVEAGRAKLWQPSYVDPIAACPGQLASQPRHVVGNGMGVWKLQFRTAPLTLPDAVRLGEARLRRAVFRPKTGWDSTSSVYDDTRAVLEILLKASAKCQQDKRTEQLTRKTILRRTANQNLLHGRLEIAIQAKKYAEAYALLDDGAFPGHATPGGLTVLSQACTEEVYLVNADGDTVLAVDYFLDRSSNRPSPNFESFSTFNGSPSSSFLPLVVAAHYGTVRCGRSLVSRGADVNARTTTTGTSALITAVRNNKDEFVQFLLSHGANVHDIHGHTALAYAAANNNEVVCAMLSQAAAEVRQTLLLLGKSTEFGLCRWGCGFVGLRDDPVVEHGHIVRLMHPLTAHEAAVCPKRVVKCPHGCGAVDLWSEEVPAHVEATCPLRQVPCANPKCSDILPFNRLQTHECQECPHRTVACSACGETSLAYKLPKHQAAHCRLRSTSCPACGDTLPAMDLSRHQKFDCVCRQVRCRLGCGFVESRLRAHHELSDCIMRSIPCVFGCEGGTTPERQAAHELECELRTVGCPNRCGVRTDGGPLRACDIVSHVQNDCPHRFVACELGCGKKVRAVDLPSHTASTCTLRLVECPRCQKQMTADELDSRHPDCRARIVPCGACGLGGIVAEHLDRHKADECKMRLVQCKYAPHGCMKHPLFAYEKNEHETMECRFRLVWCPMGCGQHVVANTVQTHQAVCGMRFSTCSLGCGVEMREKDRLDHEQFDCLYHKK
ncbi:hypothetical protein B5M09_007666 [Aphanomyces astaci]|uniref:TRAF-type domain-containing protein n=1 Tax=Aphanomyces astaci TaxID=112090 RepID=A0A3R7XW11_APHAT|nr:hypothetical protein B5M09_007666 [Aphanomyces astaci]